MDRSAILLGVLASALLSDAQAVPLPGERDLSYYTFEMYKEEFKEFGKQQYSTDEHQDRQQIFSANLALMREHNADPAKTWFATVNEFSDWTNQEFRAHRLGSRPQWKGPASPIENVKLEDLPAEVDWRTTSGVVTPPKNQGGCGSCWAFSATETLESHLAIATGQPAPVLSPQQLVSCAPNPDECGGTGGCAGSTQPLGFNYTATAGITTEADYAYQGVTGTCQQDKIKPVAKNSGYVVLPANNYTALISAVATKGPIAISLAAGGMGWQLYGGGVFGSGAFGRCGFDMDHAVQLVGYGSDAGKDYWLVRNSWGAGWGERGYIRMSRHGEGKEPCGVDSTPQHGEACKGDTKPVTLCGLCGILSASSYPTGVQTVPGEDASTLVV